jgi:hypothetical protein
MITYIIEPPAAAAARLALPKPVPSALSAREITKNPPRIYQLKPNDNYWPKLIFESLRDNGDEPMRLTSVVNKTVRHWHFAARSDRERKKIELFKLVGKLIRMGRLERVGRKYVNIPATDERYQAYLAKAASPIDLPKPNV